MTTRTVLFLVVLLGFSAGLPHVFAAEPTVKDLRAASAQVAIGDRKLILKTYLWRDFMPISPPDGKPLIASLELQTIDGTALPKGVEIETVWVINGEALWSPTAKEVRKGGENSPTMEVVVRGGPKWGPGIKVDVVVRLMDETGQSYLLRASDQNIERTD